MLLKNSINSSDIAGTWKDSKRRTASQRAQDCMEPNSAFHVCTVQTVPKILHIFAPAYLGDTKSTKYTKHICSYLFGKRHLNKIYRSYFLLYVHAVCAKPRIYHSYLFKRYFSKRTCVCVGLQETSYILNVTKPVVVFYIRIIYILPPWW